jgi:hypothetical protein
MQHPTVSCPPTCTGIGSAMYSRASAEAHVTREQFHTGLGQTWLLQLFPYYTR